ncbi:MAG: IucA/IucC family siderophore biosynthesis protein, partial [Actinocrinis sp.]
MPAPSSPAHPGHPAPTQSAPTDPELRWRHAARSLLAKTIAEFAYEDLLSPIEQEDGWHALHLDAPNSGPGADQRGVEYRFRADRGAYGSWFVDPGSVRRAGHPAADPLALVADAGPTLGLSGETSGHLVREMAATLAADAQI